MSKLDKRLELLEARVGDDDIDEDIAALIEAYEYKARVLVSFVVDIERDSKGDVRARPSPEQVEARMLARGIPAEDARRFSRMGYTAAHDELKGYRRDVFNRVVKRGC